MILLLVIAVGGVSDVCYLVLAATKSGHAWCGHLYHISKATYLLFEGLVNI